MKNIFPIIELLFGILLLVAGSFYFILLIKNSPKVNKTLQHKVIMSLVTIVGLYYLIIGVINFN